MPSIKLSHKVPVVTYDNVVVKKRTDGSIDLLFVQLTTEAENAEGDVIAAVRLPNQAAWEELKKTVDSNPGDRSEP